MKQPYNCSAFVQTKSNPDAFINREVIAESFEQAKEKFKGLLQGYCFVFIDEDSISIKAK